MKVVHKVTGYVSHAWGIIGNIWNMFKEERYSKYASVLSKAY